MDADDFIEWCEELLDNDRYRFMWDLLTGMKGTVTRTQRVTATQIQSVKNIVASVDGTRDHGPRWNRRYEGLR